MTDTAFTVARLLAAIDAGWDTHAALRQRFPGGRRTEIASSLGRCLDMGRVSAEVVRGKCAYRYKLTPQGRAYLRTAVLGAQTLLQEMKESP